MTEPTPEVSRNIPDSPPVAQVLFIEDSAAEIQLVTDLLNRARVHFEGHWVTCCEDGLGFLSHAPGFEKAPAPDLIFLDLTLPGRPGTHFLSDLHARPDLATIPVVVLSGSDHEADIEQSRRLGAVHYLVKPLNYEKLCECVARVPFLKLVSRGDELVLCTG